MSITKKEIISIARDKFCYQRVAVCTGRITARKYRDPKDRQPLGFDYHGVSMEVHVTHVRNVHVPGTTRFRHIPILLIIGIAQDGTTKVIAKGIEAYDA